MRSTIDLILAISFAVSFLPQASQARKVKSCREFHQQYNNIFQYGNRNAASHKWVNFLLDSAHEYSHDELRDMHECFCPISGSPVNPNHAGYNRYGLTLPTVSGLSDKEGPARFGFLHYCCWPCVCDSQDFLRIDSKTITAKNGAMQKHYFVVIGNPCLNEAALDYPFVDPFGRGETTIRMQAPEVRCAGNVLEKAVMSDHGHVIIGMFFDSESRSELPHRYRGSSFAPQAVQNPGSLTTTTVNRVAVPHQAEGDFDNMCADREANGHNSGMGEIFRKVAEISKIGPCTSATRPCPDELAAPKESCEGQENATCPDLL